MSRAGMVPDPSSAELAFLFIIHSCFRPCKILISPILFLHSFPLCLASVSVTGALAYFPLYSPYLTISVTTFLCPCLPEGRRKERF